MVRGANPHDSQARSLSRLSLAPIRGDERDAELRRAPELESGRYVQGIECSQPLSPGVAAPAEGGQGFHRQDGGREESMTAQEQASLRCTVLLDIALHQNAGVEVRPGASH
jgi:hypothetical protein